MGSAQDRALVESRRAFDTLNSGPEPWRATPWEWIDPTTIAPRSLIMGGHFHRGHVSVTAGAPGVSKSMREIVDAVSLCIGRDLLGRDAVHGGAQRVWMLQLEDDRIEVAGRRVAAVCLRYDIRPSEIEGRLFIDSGRDRPLCIAKETRDGVAFDVVDVEALKHEVRRRKVDVLIVDPFVESHAVSESLNGQMASVMAQWRQIAYDCDIAVELVHHLRKNGGAEASVDDVRGAGAMIGSARSVRLMSSMTIDEAKSFGIERTERRRYVSVNPHGKANFSAPSDARDWFRLETIALGNGTATYPDGDRVGVPAPWTLPGPLAMIEVEDCIAIKNLAASQSQPGITARASRQSPGWFGHLVARHLGVDVSDVEAAKNVERILAALVKNKWLQGGTAQDAKRETKPVYLPGTDEAIA